MIRTRLVRGLLTMTVMAAVAGCAEETAGGDEGPEPTTGGDVDRVPGQVVVADSLAVSPDGARVVAGCRDALCVWDAHDGSLLTTWDGGRIVAFSPDGKLVATDGFDGDRATVRLLDAAGDERTTLPGHDAEAVEDGIGTGVTALSFSPDGDLLASAGHDGAVRLWSVPGGEPVAELRPSSRAPDALAFSPDGSRLAVAGPDAPAEVFDTRSDELVGTLGEEPQGAVAWSPEGDLIATAPRAPGADARGRLWDADSLAEADSGFEPVQAYALAFSPDGSEVAVTRKDETGVQVWPLGAGDVVELTGHREPPRGVVWGPDGRRLYTASGTEGVLAWDPAGGDPVHFELPTE